MSCSQLQLLLCIPVPVLDPAAPSVVLTYLFVCPHHNQTLGAIQIKTKYSSSGLTFIWFPAPAPALTPCQHSTGGAAHRGKRRVTKPKVSPGRLQSKHNLKYPNKISLHSHHNHSELTLYLDWGWDLGTFDLPPMLESRHTNSALWKECPTMKLMLLSPVGPMDQSSSYDWKRLLRSLSPTVNTAP